MQSRLVRYNLASVSEENTASIFRVEESSHQEAGCKLTPASCWLPYSSTVKIFAYLLLLAVTVQRTSNPVGVQNIELHVIRSVVLKLKLRGRSDTYLRAERNKREGQ
jgi:hypothetical protein